MPVTQEHVFLRPRVAQFLTFCGARNLSANTVRAYKRDVTDFVEVIGADPAVTDINRKLIRAYLVKLSEGGLTRSSVYRKLAAVKTFCRWLENEGLLDSALIETLTSGRRREQLPDVPTEAEVQRLIDGDIPGKCPERDRLILELLYGAGLRASELVGINMSDFQENGVLLVRGKGKKERLAIFGECAQRALDTWTPVRKKLLRKIKLKTDALLFSVGPSQSTERLEVRTIGRIVKAVAEERGFNPEKWHPHLLRHACGTHCHDRGMTLQAVAQLLGHARLATAQIYTRVSTGRMMDVYRRAHPHAVNNYAEELSS